MLQGGEIIIIALVALVVLGPKRLPELARKLGHWTSELRAAAREISRGLDSEVADLKAAGEELKAQVEELKQPLEDIKRDVKSADSRDVDWTGPKPVSGPTPEDAIADLEEIETSSDPD
ncbi:MAG: twin-arginine translocase TatA/TatE family subunit, partial [Acidobacteria bacterium]